MITTQREGQGYNKADRAHKKLQGRGALRVAHSYTGKGGALNPLPMQSPDHFYHTIGTKLGMRMNPMYQLSRM